MIDSSQHLHHELGVQQHAVARFSPKLLLLPGEATYAQPEERTVTWVGELSLTASGNKNKGR